MEQFNIQDLAGQVGDGKIFVYTVEKVIRISTYEAVINLGGNDNISLGKSLITIS